MDFIKHKIVDLSHISYLVIDEADRMLEFNFEQNLRDIVRLIQKNRQTLMWSATWPKEVRELANDFLSNPITVVIGTSKLTINSDIIQLFDQVDREDKFQHLIDTIKKIYAENPESAKILVFTSRKSDCDELSFALQNRYGFESEAIHGGLDQSKREFVINQFRKAKKMILIGTNVVSRGIDVEDISHIINYDLPDTIEDYIHRIGRTARNTKKGVSISFFTDKDKTLSKKLIKVLHKAGQEPPEWLQRIADETSDDAYKERKNYHPRYRRY